MSVLSPREAVAAGIALLDAKGLANWRERIDLDELHISDPRRCVLAQVYRSEAEVDDWPPRTGFSFGLAALNVRDADIDQYGFAGFADVNAAWREALSS